MRVALDATPLTEPSGGIARYVAELALALRAEFPEDEYWLVSDQVWEGGPDLPCGRPPKNWLARRWWLAGLPMELRRIRADVFHGTDFGAPYLSLNPSVLTLHDCSPWLAGDLRQTAADRVRRRAPWALRAATVILTPSEAVRREVITRFGLAPSRVRATPLAPSAVFRPRPDDEVQRTLTALNLRQPYLLFVGTQDRRKNLPALIQAWRIAKPVRPGLGLVLVGRAVADSPLLIPGGEPGLTVAGRLDDEVVAALVSGAEAFVYPSLYEGFGLPVLEAMQAGAPVIISRDPALLETAGGAALTADATSPADLARAVIELTGDPSRRREWQERGWRRAAQFSWRQTAIRTRELYVEALRRF